jgi:hypothetical protein
VSNPINLRGDPNGSPLVQMAIKMDIAPKGGRAVGVAPTENESTRRKQRGILSISYGNGSVAFFFKVFSQDITGNRIVIHYQNGQCLNIFQRCPVWYLQLAPPPLTGLRAKALRRASGRGDFRACFSQCNFLTGHCCMTIRERTLLNIFAWRHNNFPHIGIRRLTHNLYTKIKKNSKKGSMLRSPINRII